LGSQASPNSKHSTAKPHPLPDTFLILDSLERVEGSAEHPKEAPPLSITNSPKPHSGACSLKPNFTTRYHNTAERHEWAKEMCGKSHFLIALTYSYLKMLTQ